MTHIDVLIAKNLFDTTYNRELSLSFFSTQIICLRNNLFTALRVPKPFLGFDETAGEGKNLALQDIRFSRTINRIQKSILAELNKIAIIHLFLLGFEDELSNFTLGLTNPSTQAIKMVADLIRKIAGE